MRLSHPLQLLMDHEIGLRLPRRRHVKSRVGRRRSLWQQRERTGANERLHARKHSGLIEIHGVVRAEGAYQLSSQLGKAADVVEMAFVRRIAEAPDLPEDQVGGGIDGAHIQEKVGGLV